MLFLFFHEFDIELIHSKKIMLSEITIRLGLFFKIDTVAIGYPNCTREDTRMSTTSLLLKIMVGTNLIAILKAEATILDAVIY